jgi:hypothetical protein
MIDGDVTQLQLNDKQTAFIKGLVVLIINPLSECETEYRLTGKSI